MQNKPRMKKRPVVLKFGTGILAAEGGCSLDAGQFRRLSSEIAALVRSGIPCIVVSSGAVAAGVDALKITKRPSELAGKQACAAVGQPALMGAYMLHLRRHGLTAAQLLLTHNDIFAPGRRRNAKVTLEKLLSSEVAQLVRARILILLTSADGLLASSGSSGGATRIPLVGDIEEAFRHVTPEKGEHSTGGMKTKLQAVQMAVGAGIETVIAHGRKPGQIAAAVEGRDVGTRFPVGKRRKRG